jgi:ketosteroid isomerase-like protein
MMREIVCCLFLLSSLALAQNGTPTPAASETPVSETETAEHPAHAELQLLRQHMEDAINAQDIDSVMEGVAPNIVFSTLDGDVVKGQDGIRSYFNQVMKGPDARFKSAKTHFELDELTILYSGTEDPSNAKFGIAYGHSDDEYILADDTVIKVQPRWSATLVRDPDTWKIASFHQSVNMFDNPVLGKLKGMIGLVGGAGLLLGVVIGFFLGRRKS